MKNLMFEKLQGSDGMMDVQGFSAGLYLLNLKTTDGLSETIKVVID